MKNLEVKYIVLTQDIKEDTGLGVLQASLLLHPESLCNSLLKDTLSVTGRLRNIRGACELLDCYLIVTFIFYAFKPCWLLNQGPHMSIIARRWLTAQWSPERNCLLDGPWTWCSGNTITWLDALGLFFLLALFSWSWITGVESQPHCVGVFFMPTCPSWFPWPPQLSQELICPVCPNLLCVHACCFWRHCGLCQLSSKATLIFVQWSILSKFLFCWTKIRC